MIFQWFPKCINILKVIYWWFSSISLEYLIQFINMDEYWSTYAYNYFEELREKFSRVYFEKLSATIRF